MGSEMCIRDRYLEFPAAALGCHDLLALGLAGHCRDARVDLAVALLLTPRKEAAQIGEVALSGAEGDVVGVDELGDLKMPHLVHHQLATLELEPVQDAAERLEVSKRDSVLLLLGLEAERHSFLDLDSIDRRGC